MVQWHEKVRSVPLTHELRKKNNSRNKKQNTEKSKQSPRLNNEVNRLTLAKGSIWFYALWKQHIENDRVFSSLWLTMFCCLMMLWTHQPHACNKFQGSAKNKQTRNSLSLGAHEANNSNTNESKQNQYWKKKTETWNGKLNETSYSKWQNARDENEMEENGAKPILTVLYEMRCRFPDTTYAGDICERNV